VSRQHFACAVARRCSTKFILAASLFIFLALSTLYTSPTYSVAYREPSDGDTSASSSVVLLPPVRNRRGNDTSSASASVTSALLAMPDCDAIIAGDQAEILSTQRMLFRETPTTSFAAADSLSANCSSMFQRPANVDGLSTYPRLAYIISDADSSVEQTELLLRAVYVAANIYCLTLDLCSSSDQVATTLRRLTSCFSNVIVVERTRCTDTGSTSRDRKGNATTAAWWRCVDKLLHHDVDWTHVVSLTVADFPLRPPDNIARRLSTEKFDVRQRNGNDVIQCGAYTRSAISLPWTLLSTRGKTENESSITTSEIHSLDGASALEVCARKCTTVNHDDEKTARCYYTIADLPSLVRRRKLFAHAFNLNVDHYAVLCLMQRIIKWKN